ncbi:MAG TPA: hypothetical protein PKY77_03885 [Phycisphaerae bacterium]|nr:hypothetical protein [Phycisphaerae bacterium]HRY70918.1 hypothetical protein [Phycisphaerae bacterium]HSA27785.1 hypothetical protein [Phycisphaerae bacterium]
MMCERIECVCPECRATYHVPGKAAGRRARCRRCGTIFRIVRTTTPVATEDDILRWLGQGEDEEDRSADRSENANDGVEGTARDRASGCYHAA